jgi:hypothetical protein
VVQRFFRTGSFGNGTSIYGHSDVDYFVSLGRDYLTANSTYTLTSVRDALNTRFPSTGVRVNCPAVRVPFGVLQPEITEIVPAQFVGTTRKHNFKVYEIPDCQSGWMRSSPDAHNAYVRAVDAKHSGRAKALIRLIKAWKYLQTVPISSFYLELRVAKYAATEKSIEYAHDVQRVFDLLFNNDLAHMQDPMKISGYIHACKSEVSYSDARSKLMTASTRADKALDACKRGKLLDAFYWWNLLWGDNFPKYYR